MSRILQAIHKALRMAGAEPDMPQDPRLSDVVRRLRSHGLRLAVVNAEEPSLRLSAQWLLRRAMERALANGEPERGMAARLALLVGRSQPRVTRALSGDADMDEEAREALEAHLLEPKRHPLPEKAPEGRPPRDPEKAAALEKTFREAPPEWQEVFDETARRDPKMQAKGKK